MDFHLPKRRSNLRDQIREFVEKEITREYAREIDAKDEYPGELLKKLSGLGFMRVNIPEEYGGLGGDVIDTMIIYEEISKRLPVLAWALGNILLYGNEIITINGSESQKKAYLPDLARGGMKFCFALTEPNAGSDAAGIRTRAVYADGYYVLNGSKIFITGAGVSDIAITFARTGEERYRGITAFLVRTKSAGYQARPLVKLGYRGSNTCEVSYEDVKVPPEDILGGEGCLNRGWNQMVKLLNTERLVLSSCALGIAQAALDDALSFARERYRGNSEEDLQGVKHRLVEMATELEAARWLAYFAAWKQTRRLECAKESSMSKWFSTETAKKIVLQGINVLGEYGAAMSFDLQRYLRDVLILSIGGGTTQIQKNIIAKSLGL